MSGHDLSPEQLIELMVEEAWHAFIDSNPELHEALRRHDRDSYELIRTAHNYGFTSGYTRALEYAGLDQPPSPKED